MPRSRFDDDDDDDRPRRRRRRDDDHDPHRPRRNRGGPPIGLIVGGVVGLVLLVVGGIVLALTTRNPREDAKADPAGPGVPEARPLPGSGVPPAKVEPPKPAYGTPMPEGTDGVR